MLATDTPDMAARGDVAARRRAGDEPLFLPRPRHAERHHPASGAGRAVRGDGATARGMPLQRSAHIGALTELSYVQLVGAGRRLRSISASHALHAFVARGLRPRRPRRADAAAGRGASRAIDAELQPRPRRLRPMSYYLGIDIGTFESKGVLVDADGRDRRQRRASRTRCWCRSRAGPSTGRSEDWWGDFTFITRKLLAGQQGRARRRSAPSATQRDRPLHAAGRCRRRAADERRALRRRRARRRRRSRS